MELALGWKWFEIRIKIYKMHLFKKNLLNFFIFSLKIRNIMGVGEIVGKNRLHVRFEKVRILIQLSRKYILVWLLGNMTETKWFELWGFTEEI